MERWGRITVISREWMDAASCGCYQVVRDVFDKPLGREAEPAAGSAVRTPGGEARDVDYAPVGAAAVDSDRCPY